MKVSFDATADRGSQFSVMLDNGAVLAAVSQATALSLLQGAGLSIREAAIVVAQAKAADAAAAATA